MRHDFPTEWSAFVNGEGDFGATIRKDYFPYFTQGKPITVVGLELYGQDVTKHHATGDPDAATTALAGQAQFNFSAGPDAAGPNQVLTRTAGLQVFLIVLCWKQTRLLYALDHLSDIRSQKEIGGFPLSQPT